MILALLYSQLYLQYYLKLYLEVHSLLSDEHINLGNYFSGVSVSHLQFPVLIMWFNA